MRLSRPTSPRRRAGLAPRIAAVAAAVAAAGVAVVGARRRRGHTVIIEEPVAPVVPGPPSQEPVAETVEQTWTCECGQELRVRGEDRHRVYWLPDAAVSDPVLSPDCPSCERPLPREHAAGAAQQDEGAAEPPTA